MDKTKVKTRVVQTKFWRDEFIGELSPTEKLLYLYLLTNEYVNIIHLYECPDKRIMFETGLNSEQLEKGKQDLQSGGKVFFKDGFVYLYNSNKYEDFTGESNDTAKERLLSELSNDIRTWYIDIKERGVYTPQRGANNKNTVISNKKQVIREYNNKEFLESEDLLNHLKEKFPSVLPSALKRETENMIDWVVNAGKKGKKNDYRAFARTWIRKSLDNLPKKPIVSDKKILPINKDGLKMLESVKDKFKVGK
jgi:hypothetical protein